MMTNAEPTPLRAATCEYLACVEQDACLSPDTVAEPMAQMLETLEQLLQVANTMETRFLRVQASGEDPRVVGRLTELQQTPRVLSREVLKMRQCAERITGTVARLQSRKAAILDGVAEMGFEPCPETAPGTAPTSEP